MSEPNAEQIRIVQDMLHGLRERVGVQALQGAEASGFAQRNERAMAAMVVLIAAAREVSEAMGLRELFMAMCAAEVPSTVQHGKLPALH